MEKVAEYSNTLIAVTAINHMQMLVEGDPELLKLMDGDFFEDNNPADDMETFPKEPGIYRATVEYYFQRGTYEGWDAPGESEWAFRLKDVVKVVSIQVA